LAQFSLQPGTYDIANGSLPITVDGTYTITGTATNSSNTITVASGVNATIILDNVTWSSGLGQAEKTSFTKASAGSNVTVTLVGTTSIDLQSGYSVTSIWSENDGTSVANVTINGTGTLNISNAHMGAAIGAPAAQPCGNITFTGNTTVKAVNNFACAGVGAGNHPDQFINPANAVITIEGGFITSISGGENDDGIAAAVPSFGARQMLKAGENNTWLSFVITGGNVVAGTHHGSGNVVEFTATPTNGTDEVSKISFTTPDVLFGEVWNEED